MRYYLDVQPEAFEYEAPTDHEAFAFFDHEFGEFETSSGDPTTRWVQAALGRILGLQLAEDGIMGPATRNAIRMFQTRQGLTADGIVGPRTKAALTAAGAPAAPQSDAVARTPAAVCPPTTIAVDCPPPTLKPELVLDNFAFDSAAIVAARHRPPIIAFARRVLASQGTAQPIRTILVSGHTDAVGDDDYNFALARRRADAVAQELCTTFERMRPGSMRSITLQLTSCGERQTKSTPENSRRVELFVPVVAKPVPPKPVPPKPHLRPRPPRPQPVPPEIQRLIRIVGTLLQAIPGLGKTGVKIPTTLRFLNPLERREAAKMFGAGLDFTRILISDGLGAQGRPFTVSVPSGGTTMIVMSLGDVSSWHAAPRSHTLIHELTHAWQSQHHGTDPSAFMANSVKCQGLAIADTPIAKAQAAEAAVAAATARGVFNPVTLAGIGKAAANAEDVSAYAYIPGKAFSAYGAEQIAEQVEDAYRGTGRPTAAVVAHVKSLAANAPSTLNQGSLNTISFERKSTPGVVFH
jgi:outer membrane protein OmpA-like peptidoglycan-associated protein